MRDRRGKKTGRRSLKKKAPLCGGLTLICLAGLWVYGESRPVVDTLYPEQWNLEAIHIEEAWGAGLTGEGVTIGVIDSGTAEHEDLDESRITGRSYVDEDPEDYKDSRGHGTFVTGLLAAKRGNGKGIAGLTQSAVREYKVAGEQPHIGAADVAQAIRDGADEGCGVLNLSIGTPNANEEMEEAVRYALERGVIVIAAAGGEPESPYYPAACEGVIGVGGVTEEGEPLEKAAQNESVDVTAPGEGLVSLSLSGGYETEGAGSSYAAAQVTAMAAFAKQERPELTAEDFAELLKRSVRDEGEPGYDTAYGWGVIDFGLFTEALLGEEGERP